MNSNPFRLHGATPREVARRTWLEIRADDVFGRAAQLAYYFFLALFPFLICVVASLSVFGNADRGRALLFGILAQLLPPMAFDLISKTFNEILQSTGPLKMSFGILFSLWSASMGMSAVMDTLNAAYRVKEGRSLFNQYAVAISLTTGLTVLLVLSTLLAILGNKFVAERFDAASHIVIVWKFAKWPTALALVFFAMAIVYYFAPNQKDRQWHWITPGAVVGVLLLLAISIGLRIYIHFSGNYAATYGSLGAVIVLLLCFYLGGAAVLLGGALNAVLESIAAGRKREISEQKDLAITCTQTS
ncbi:MAG TPA: YihY/virulence factor BrkB family protein [Candidatus Acidoferrales bacterium]|nr:YihY/virulence factor BrkB family protein [Candidatus Acidoferrales bacterium]